MNCFNYPDTASVGTCKACSKGLCHQCAMDLGHGLSCKGEHEATVQSYRDMFLRSQRVVAAAPSGILDFTIILGGGFLVYAVVCYLQSKKALTRRQ